MTYQGKNIVGERVKQDRLSAKPSLMQDELSGRVAIHGVKHSQYLHVGTSVGEAGERCQAIAECACCA